ncbi:Vacuolar protein sorting-associated protein 2 [Ananas comosus]|uniref:Vacuolar protein sorting-associated protein 28 homolog n=1 Tax=Ananas comosus TaxID=4615 RepID=A0A199V7C4_ANACO|nr:Vacuolar protein sorting-associated protein 2 [Ananas comosus]
MEVKLWHDKRERELLDSLADLYAIIKTTEKLEKAYVRDLVSSTEYEAECLKLIAQFRTLSSSLRDAVPSVDRFADAYKMDCPAALNRLLVSGVPATVEHRASASSASASAAASSASAIAQCVQHFITAMDAVKLNMVAVDQVHPSSPTSPPPSPSSAPSCPRLRGKVKVREWLARLAKMGAADELTEQQSRQLHFDLDSSYNAFMAALPSAGS